MDPLETEKTIHLSDYYHIMAKHKALIVMALFVTVTLTGIFTFLMQPVYRASATMVIENEQSTSPLTGERVGFESYISQTMTFKTHFKLITSRAVLEKVINKLKLEQFDEDKGIEIDALKEIITQFKDNLHLLLKVEEKPLSPNDKHTLLVGKLRDKIKVSEVRDTRLLKISVEDHDPILAKKIANTLAAAYIQFNTSNRLENSRNTLQWMKGELYGMKKKLEDAEEAFMAYKQRVKLFSISGKLKVISQKIEDFNDAYLKTRNKRLEVGAKIAALKKPVQTYDGYSQARALIDNPLIQGLYKQLLDAEVEHSRLSKVYRAKHPKIIQVKSQIKKTQIKLDQEVNKEIDNLKAERNLLTSREKVLAKTIADFENDAMQINSRALKYNILKRNVETNQKLYDTLLAKLKESNIEEKLDVSNIRIAEKAAIPVAPVKPKKKLNIILSVIFGLMTGVGLAFFMEYLDRSLRTEEDVQRYLEIPVLSIVPVAESSKRIKNR